MALPGLIVALALLALLPGCVAATAGGAAIAASADRSIGDQVNDATIKAAISAVWRKTNSEMASGLECDVYEGRVLITGRVPNPAWIEDAIRIAWRVKGVQQVYNEITVGPVSSTGDDLSDGFISTRLRNELLWDADVRSVNFIVTTSDHVVFLIGSARTPQELERVTGYARNIPNVKRVVSYVQVQGNPAPATSAPPQPATSGAGTPASPQPIQSQPLQ
ncbi:MAG: BON domain-containing protein [Stellaceae bacterium]